MFKSIMIKTLILNAIGILTEKLVNKIDHDELRNFVGTLVLKVQKIAEILFDSNPNNKEQFAALWVEVKSEMLDLGLDFIILVLEKKIKDPFVRDMVISLLRTLDKDGNDATLRVTTTHTTV
jgi:hypothetical protein